MLFALIHIQTLNSHLQAIEEFLDDPEYIDLQSKYQLGNADWQALDAFKRILGVSCNFNSEYTSHSGQVPHAFQQCLSSENTPTLCDAIPSFERMIKVWEADKQKHPETSEIVQTGIDKLESYMS